MKTLEEKAKAYDEALEMAKDFYKANQKLGEMEENDMLSDIFPELKESKESEDKRIRKAILNEITLLEKECVVEERKEVYRTWISWLEKHQYTQRDVDNAYVEGIAFAKNELEKQGEQKPIVIPKFKVGDKVRLKGSCGWYNVTEIRGVEYYLTSNDVVPCLLPICEQDDWEVEQKPLPLIDGNYILKATEEYRKDRESCGIKDPVMLNEIETAYFAGATLKQRPVEWSEDDNAFLDDIICKVKHDLILNKDEKDWLKSIKQRIGG